MRLLFLLTAFAFFLGFSIYKGLQAGPQVHYVTPITVDDFKVDDYYKFNVGTTWTYKKTSTEGDTNNGTVTHSTFNVSVTKVSNTEVFMGRMVLRVNGDYLMAGMLQEDGNTVLDNLRVMKTNMKAGDSWDGLAVETSEEVKATFVGLEDLEAPAGKFKAVHIRYAGGGITMDFWHVAKVGMVKVAVKADNFQSEQVLQKYVIK